MIRLEGLRLNLLFKRFPDKASRQALNLFSKPRKFQIWPERKDFLATAEQKIIQKEGYRIQVYFWEGGKRGKVLLAHGWESNAGRWRQVTQWLREAGFGVIALDAPAHGNSSGKYFSELIYGETIRELVEEYQVNYTIGHSLGGLTLLLEEVKRPIFGLRKMIFMGAPSELTAVGQGFQKGLRLSPKLMAAFEALAQKDFGYNLMGFSVTAMSEGLAIPTLFIHDKEDATVDYRQAVNIANTWKNTELFLTKGLGHSLQGEQVYKKIVTFLKG